MSWNQSLQNGLQNNNGSSSDESSSIGNSSNLQSLCYLLLNNGNLQDLMKQQQLLQADRVCHFLMQYILYYF